MVARYASLDSRRLAKVFDLVGEACRATTWGEFLDMEMARGTSGTEKDYEEMIRLKTSTLLSAPCISGALVGGASDAQASLAGKFGEELGMAYQIQDDALDLVGDESALGKPTFTDLRGGKKSVILLHCLDHCSGDDRRFVLGLLNRSESYSEGEVSRLKRLLEVKGSLEYAKERVLSYTDRARKVLETVPGSVARSRLSELADYLAMRYF
jgi:geranylgeranyl diphosphate synthase type I